jgi:phosphohistidine phosphatase
MPILSLLRHAKSSWDNPRLKDYDRPLAQRGIAAAGRMGAYMATQHLAPAFILCSPALRTRQTLDLVLPHLQPAPRVEFEDDIYLAAVTTLLARIRKVEPNVAHLMLVGHEPGIPGLALKLSDTTNAEARRAMASKFPTAALAVIKLKGTQWATVRAGSGRLELFMTPKLLPE